MTEMTKDWPKTNDSYDPPLTNEQMEQVQETINQALTMSAIQEQALALRQAAAFKRENRGDHDFWTDLAERRYTAGDDMVALWLEERADQLEAGARS